ncbi:MAG: hypothetical protein Q8N18_17855 [Opitutaceae bacterium]|nr:hypothetical protein [Opitutaceae bacterium]
MPFLLRLVLIFLIALTPTLTTGAVPAASAPIPDLPPELAALLVPPSPWGIFSRVESSFGFKDNLLLSSTAEERSVFVRGSAEVVVLRLPTGAFDYSMLTEATGTRYFTGQATKHDARAYFFSELGWKPRETWRLSLPVIGYYRDEVIDQSDTDFRRDLSAIKALGANITPTVHWAFHPAWWLEIQGGVERKRFRVGSNDWQHGEGALRLGWKPGDRLKLRFMAERRWRNYDSRLGLTSAGRELPQLLRIAERKGEVRIDYTWDRSGKWKSAARAGVLDYRDNASGFLNFGQFYVAHDLEWKTGPWLMRLGGSARRAAYDVQKVGFGLAPPQLIREDYDAEWVAERQISKRWTVLAKYQWERSRSNDPLSSYVLNEGLLGLRWNWDK